MATRSKPRSPTLRVVSSPRDAAAREVVNKGLERFNLAVTGNKAYRPVGFFLKTRTGEVLGGLHGFIWGGWMFVRMFWLPEELRGTGHGRRLLRAAEALARKKGCVGAYLDTFSFQARPFYEQEGYTVYGTREDSPLGFAHHYLAKRFDGRPVSGRRPATRRVRAAAKGRKPRGK